MVMTRRAKRVLEQDDAPAAAIHGHSTPTYLSLTYPLPFTSHQEADARALVNVSSVEICSLKPPSEEVAPCLTTTAEAKIDKPPLQVHPLLKPCSAATLKSYPTQHYKRVPCRRNKSTAAVGAVKRDINDKETVGICVNIPLFEIHHSPEFQDSTTQLMKGSDCIQSLSPSPFHVKDANNESVLNEHKSLTEVIMPIAEERPDSQSEADSNARQSTSPNLSVMDSLDDDASIINSEISSTAVTIGGYRVREDLAPILRDIISKYGDIAAQCCKKSIMLRSLLVENVCDIVHKLQTADFVYLTPAEVDNFRVFVQDIESDGVEVKWLLQRLDEIHEAKRLLKGSSKVKQAKSQSRQAIKEKEEQICELEKKIASAKQELEEEMVEERKLDEILSYTKAQVKRFHCRSMSDGLL